MKLDTKTQNETLVVEIFFDLLNREKTLVETSNKETSILKSSNVCEDTT
mgnify:FL=1